MDPRAVVREVPLARAVQRVHAVDVLVALGVGGLGAVALVGDLLAVGREVGGLIIDQGTVVGEVGLTRSVGCVHGVDLYVALGVGGLGALARVEDLLAVW